MSIKPVDYLIVGAGVTGATVAWCLQQAGREVVVLEQRAHIAGNCYDAIEPLTGLRFHHYGPHAFRTAKGALWSWLNDLVTFFPFALRVKTLIRGRMEVWPPTRAFLRQTYGIGWKSAFQGRPVTFEDAARAAMPDEVYELFVRPYTEKHWGRSATELWPGLVSRFRIGVDDDERLSRHPYQGLPVGG